MPIRNDSVLTDFNAIGALQAVEDRIGDEYVFTPHRFRQSLVDAARQVSYIDVSGE